MLVKFTTRHLLHDDKHVLLRFVCFFQLNNILVVYHFDN
jgi:hypothetical protein